MKNTVQRLTEEIQRLGERDFLIHFCRWQTEQTRSSQESAAADPPATMQKSEGRAQSLGCFALLLSGSLPGLY